MSLRKDESTSWDPCPEGELPRMVAKVRARRRRQQIGQVGSIAVAVFVGVAVGGYFLFSAAHRDDQFRYGGVVCDTVQAGIEQYVAGELPADVAERFRIHLAECPRCGPLYRQIISNKQASVACHDPYCPHCRPLDQFAAARTETSRPLADDSVP